jgi:hypothetical protein
MLTPEQLIGAIYAVALANGFTNLTAAGEQVEKDGAKLVEEECFISLNEVESDILPRKDISGHYNKTDKAFFMAQAPSYKCWHYSPLNDGIQPYDRDALINEIIEKAQFPDKKPNKK